MFLLLFPHAAGITRLGNYNGTVPELNGSNNLPDALVLFWERERGEMKKNNYWCRGARSGDYPIAPAGR